MKYLTIIALAAMALSLGACAHKDDQQSHSMQQTHSSTRGYGK